MRADLTQPPALIKEGGAVNGIIVAIFTARTRVAEGPLALVPAWSLVELATSLRVLS